MKKDRETLPIMQKRDVHVAAQHAYSILRWAPSREPMSEEELRDTFKSIYNHVNLLNRISLSSDDYYAEKTIVYENVKIAYEHFFGEDFNLPSIRQLLFDAGR